MNVVKKYCTKFKRYGERREGIFDSVEVHSIGAAQNSAAVIRENMNQYSPDGIVHAIVDAETEGLVLEILPDDNVAWADAGYGNRHSFTFEIAESDFMKYQPGSAEYKITDEKKFLADINRGYRNAVAYAALKCKQFGFNPLEKLENGLFVLYSHDEGGRFGVSSGHVDPTHIWRTIGKTMDDFRREVADTMKDDKIQEPPISQETADRQEPPINQETAGIQELPINQGTADIQKLTTNQTVETTDKIWMDWVRRESGGAGFRQTNGDHGNAYGKYQFDRRYALVPFLQFCMEYRGEHYGVFEPFVGYGAGSPKLLNNTALAKQWISVCDKWPGEFETLQDIYAYRYYYAEARRYIRNLFGIEMDSRAPAVKGTLFSMAIRSGSLTGARKFEKCGEHTPDDGMINSAYAVYGGQDAGRWTRAGQWGDALRALETGSYTEVRTAIADVPGSQPGESPETVPGNQQGEQPETGPGSQQGEQPETVPGSQPGEQPETVPGSSMEEAPERQTGTSQEFLAWYRVRRSWTDADSQAGAFHNLELAKRCADDMGYNVYDTDGKQIYRGQALTPAQKTERATAWMEQIAADNSHGYDNANSGRWGQNGDYDCSGLNISAWERVGVPVRTAGAVKTANMRKVYLSCGFEDITDQVNLKNGKGLLRGDVLLVPGKHVEQYCGNGQVVGARINELGKMVGGKQGDQTGNEIAKSSYYNYPWKYVLRYNQTLAYRVQAGSFLYEENARKLMGKLKNKKFPAIIKNMNSQYIVQCGVFAVKENAEELVKQLKKSGFDAILK